ncbi:MAG: ATP-binding cassette domain-containing protein [Micrococcales bacterium]|nr:ATP-binding cassette domain-containing protein [Micrococcales bacterium]
MPLVTLRSVTFAYAKGPTVITEASLVVERGQSVCLWGPSGSGKSTLLALVGGVVRPQSGDVVVHTSTSEADVCTAWVAQSPTVFPRLTAAQNVAMGAILRGSKPGPAHAQAVSLLDRLGLGDLAEKRARELSGGQAQRVTIGRALAASPDLLLADEPTGQLDRTATGQVCEVMLATAPGTAVVVASHDEYVAARCDRVITIWDGQVHETRP